MPRHAATSRLHQHSYNTKYPQNANANIDKRRCVKMTTTKYSNLTKDIGSRGAAPGENIRLIALFEINIQHCKPLKGIPLDSKSNLNN